MEQAGKIIDNRSFEPENESQIEINESAASEVSDGEVVRVMESLSVSGIQPSTSSASKKSTRISKSKRASLYFSCSRVASEFKRRNCPKKVGSSEFD